MDKKETKNIITRETVEKELKRLNKAEIHSFLVLFIVMTLVCVPVSILLIYGFFSVGRHIVLLGIGCFLLSFALLIPVVIQLVSLITALNETQLLKNGDWFVDVDELQYKTEEMEQRHTINVLHFYKHGRVVSGDVSYQLASQGDPFYLVVYKKKKPRVALYYSQKLYEYREDGAV